MSFLTALAYAAGGFGKGRQQAYQNRLAQQQQQQQANYENRQLGIEEQNADLNRQVTAQQLEDYKRTNAQAVANRAFESRLQLPAKWGLMSPDQRTAYLLVRQNAAARAGDTDIVNETQKQLDQIYGLTKVGLQAQSRAALEQAIMAGEMQRAILGADTRIQTTGMNNSTSRANNQNTVSGAMGRTVYTQGAENSRLGTRLADADKRQQRSIAAADARAAASVQERYVADADRDVAKMYHDNAISTRDGKPLPFPVVTQFETSYGAALGAVTKDPTKLSAVLSKIQASEPIVGPTLVNYAVQHLRQAAAEAQAARIPANAHLVPPISPPVTLPPPALPQQ